MRRIRGVLAVLAVCAVVTAAVACTDDKPAAKRTTTTTGLQSKPPQSASTSTASFLDSYSEIRTFASLVRGTELAKRLSGKGPFTVFAPTEEAFAELGERGVTALKEAPDLVDRLSRHIAAERYSAADLLPKAGSTIESLAGPLDVSVSAGLLQIGGATVTRTDIVTKNGVIHLINGIIPPAITAPGT